MWNSRRSTHRKGLEELIKEQMLEQNPRLRLQESAKKAMSRRGKKKRTALGQLLSLPNHGKLVATGRRNEPLLAVRWIGQDYIITRAVYLPPWRDWPSSQDDLQAHMTRWRRSTHEVCMSGLQDIGIDFGYRTGWPWLPKLEACLESVAVLRIVPPRGKFFETDSRLHWAHAPRDGMYDVWAGMKFDKNQKPIWLGQNADDDSGNTARRIIPCQYNETKSDGHGMALIYRFRPEFMELLPKLRPTGSDE